MHIRGFLRLLGKYRNASLSKEKRELMDRWYELTGEESGELTDKELVKERIWDRILSVADQKETASEEPYLEPGRRWLSASVKIAFLSVIIMAGLFWYLRPVDVDVPGATRVPGASEEWVRVENVTGKSRELQLADGSRVVLEPGSTLRYPHTFSPESRTVYTEGDILFDVARDTLRPFFAYSGELLVSVLGTSFTIREIGESSATEVAVLSGKVVVEKKQNTGEREGKPASDSRVVLTPNKKVTFFKSSDHYVTGLVENPVLVEKSKDFIRPEAFDFDEVPLSRILEKLEKAYGVSVTVSDEAVLNCLITADLSSDNLYGKIEVISAILNARYEVRGSSILLSDCLCSVLEK